MGLFSKIKNYFTRTPTTNAAPVAPEAPDWSEAEKKTQRDEITEITKLINRFFRQKRKEILQNMDSGQQKNEINQLNTICTLIHDRYEALYGTSGETTPEFYGDLDVSSGLTETQKALEDDLTAYLWEQKQGGQPAKPRIQRRVVRFELTDKSTTPPDAAQPLTGYITPGTVENITQKLIFAIRNTVCKKELISRSTTVFSINWFKYGGNSGRVRLQKSFNYLMTGKYEVDNKMNTRALLMNTQALLSISIDENTLRYRLACLFYHNACGINSFFKHRFGEYSFMPQLANAIVDALSLKRKEESATYKQYCLETAYTLYRPAAIAQRTARDKPTIGINEWFCLTELEEAVKRSNRR